MPARPVLEALETDRLILRCRSTDEAHRAAAGRHRPTVATRALRTLAVGVREIVADPDPDLRPVRLVEAMLWVGIGSLQAYLPIYALTILLPTWQIGGLAGGRGIAYVVSRPVMGIRSDRLASRTPLIIAGSLLCIGTLIAILYAASFLVLLALRVVFGLGTGIVTPSTMATIADLVTRGNYGSAMGVFGSPWDAGHASSPVVFGFLLVALGYRTSWLIMAPVMAAALIVSLAGTRHQSRVASQEAPA